MIKAPERQIDWRATEKQIQAYTYLKDNITTEVVYGGAAGGAKSYLGCAWLIINCYNYPGSRWLMGRVILKQLKQSTLLTFFDVCRQWKLRINRDYTYNALEGVITFTQTKSQIYLKDLAYYPSDPEYDSLGSTEYTGAFIDEASQIREKAKNVVKSRLRYKIDDYGILPKLLMTCNPSKNFLYTEFYKPWRDHTLPAGKAFVPALPGDNPFLSKEYIKSLETLDRFSKERLLKGNWDYDDDPGTLMDFEAISDIFTNKVEDQDPGEDAAGRPLPDKRPRYIVCDVARFGEDRTVITVWHGWECTKVLVYKRTSVVTVAGLIREQAEKYGVSASHVMVDEDGVGGGVKDQLYGVKGFVANSRPIGNTNYSNFKAQCAYALAKRVSDRKIAIRIENVDMKQQLMEELAQIKANDIDKDSKLRIVPKEQVVANLGRSPDLSDCMLMRMAFDYAKKPRLTYV